MTAASRHLVFDLAHCFVPYLSLESINALFGYLTPLLDVSCLYDNYNYGPQIISLQVTP